MSTFINWNQPGAYDIMTAKTEINQGLQDIIHLHPHILFTIL